LVSKRVLKEVEACAAILWQLNEECAGKFNPSICQTHSKKGEGDPDERRELTVIAVREILHPTFELTRDNI
jgi:hypothetical protein